MVGSCGHSNEPFVSKYAGSVLNSKGARGTQLHGFIYSCYLCRCSEITGVWNSESQMHIIEHCVPWKVAGRVDNLVLPVLQFQNMCVWYNIPSWADINHCRLNDCFVER